MSSALTPKVRPTSEMIRSTVTGIGWLSVRISRIALCASRMEGGVCASLL